MHHNVSQILFRKTFFTNNYPLVAEITGHSIMSGAGFVIALGVLILILSVLGKEFFKTNLIIKSIIVHRFYWRI